MTYSVILDRILVIKEEADIGMYVESNYVRGRVLSVGAGTPDEPMQVKVDDIILFDTGRSNKLPFEENLYVIEQKSVIVIENENKTEKI